MDEFQYKPLVRGDFRLLQVSCEENEGPIVCTLQHELFDIKTCDYWALSYVCDQKPLDQQTDYLPQAFIVVNSKKFPVKWNLWNALQHLRAHFIHRMENHKVWIDAICIHQTDLEEKNYQMGMMGDIYKGALRVHAWLGESAQDSDRVLRKAIPIGEAHTRMWSTPTVNGLPLKGFSSLNVSPEDIQTRRQEIHDNLELDTDDVAAFHRLLLRPYWERVWILQEAAMGYQVVFHCGSICIPWEYFGWLCDAIDQQPFDLWDQLDFNEVLLERNLVTQIRRRARPLHILRSQWNSLATYEKLTLLGLAQKFRDWRSTDPKDHIFALSALAFQEDVDLNKPDYTMSPSRVFGRLVLTHANKYGRLDGLNFHTSNRQLDLPSWVPDFSSPSTVHSLISLPSMSLEWLLTPKTLFSAAGDTKPKCSIDLDTDELHVSGINCDMILDTGPIFPDDNFSGTTTPSLQAWDSQMSEKYRSWAPGSYGSTSEYTEAIKRLIVADTTFSGRQNEGIYVTEEIGEEGVKRIFLARMWKANYGRRPIFTIGGFIGLGPRNTQEGDVVTVLFGGQTPYILRPICAEGLFSKYRFIGECYVDTIMDGEVLEQWDPEIAGEVLVLV